MTRRPSETSELDRSEGRSVFGTDPQGYHAGRLGYPDEMYTALFARSVPHPHILEIGAGTGLATEGLLRSAPQSYTIAEADAQLAAYLNTKFADQGIKIFVGPFPDAPVTGRFDLITCAAAFHWLEPVAALAQIRALLNPGGVWAMWWNSYLNPDCG
ncbi:MAG: class I SAM-dependent methyltransferase, partial [Alphaproteobacteria bacterium]|nr:class I SAM-dependent methyltransferase [Alphaproteobacteria bacterium]